MNSHMQNNPCPKCGSNETNVLKLDFDIDTLNDIVILKSHCICGKCDYQWRVEQDYINSGNRREMEISSHD